MERRAFIAGATGATGSRVARGAGARSLGVVSHVRPRSGDRADLPPGAVVFDLGDQEQLLGALAGCTTVIQLIGTMRQRFGQGDTYETSDIGTTARLVEAATEAAIDHFVLLSSVGAGRPVGGYLRAKAEAERIVLNSGIPWTVLRPSSFDGGGHRPPPGLGFLTQALGLDSLRPIPIDDLATTILHVAARRAPLGTILEGKSLWSQVRQAAREQAAQDP